MLNLHIVIEPQRRCRSKRWLCWIPIPCHSGRICTASAIDSYSHATSVFLFHFLCPPTIQCRGFHPQSLTVGPQLVGFSRVNIVTSVKCTRYLARTATFPAVPIKSQTQDCGPALLANYTMAQPKCLTDEANHNRFLHHPIHPHRQPTNGRYTQHCINKCKLN